LDDFLFLHKYIMIRIISFHFTDIEINQFGTVSLRIVIYIEKNKS